jgi:hypothetical protein
MLITTSFEKHSGKVANEIIDIYQFRNEVAFAWILTLREVAFSRTNIIYLGFSK